MSVREVRFVCVSQGGKPTSQISAIYIFALSVSFKEVGFVGVSQGGKVCLCQSGR